MPKKPKKINERSVRLSSNVIPITYKLSLKPDLKKFTFEGTEQIDIVLKKPTAQITLHCKEIQISISETCVKIGKDKVFADKISYDHKTETATLCFSKKIPAKKTSLFISFTGILNDTMRGFYRSSYTHDNKTKFIATTQFEATDARRAFPCFDEPALKATFEVNLIVQKEHTAISNTVVYKTSEQTDGFKIVHFTPSPKMSTYLLAFIVGDFEHIEGQTKENVQVRVFTTPGKIHQAQFALECATKTLSFFNEYFDIAYPLPILDLIAIPDFSSGAMENWGAITYRESALLIDSQNSSASNKQWVALVIAHEIAHQWFGNLVTMEWWTDLWLNEGFASYIEYLAVDHLFPEWDIWTQFATHDLNRALELDALKHTHPIEIIVNHPDEIGEIFDAVSYSKGASIIRMLAHYIGETNFKNGLRHYLKKHKYSNTVTKDLWSSLEKVSGMPVAQVMKNWTSKGGHPLVTVSEEIKKEKGVIKTSILCSQSRYYSSGVSAKKEKDTTIWNVPLSIATKNKHISTLLKIKNSKVLKPTEFGDAWYKVNAGETSFARIAYSEPNFSKLVLAFEAKELSPIDRLGLVRDVFSLAESGNICTTQALKLVSHAKNEDNLTVWTEILSGLSEVHAILEGKNKIEFKTFARNILQRIKQKVENQKTNSHTDILLRSLILGSLVKFNDPETILFGMSLYSQMKKDKNSVKADDRIIAYASAVKSIKDDSPDRKQKLYTELISLYKKETLHEEQSRIVRALASFEDATILKQVIEFSLSDDVRIQDKLSVLVLTWFNSFGKKLVWQTVQKKWAFFAKTYGDGGFALGRLMQGIEAFNTAQEASEVKVFFKKNKAPGAERALQQSLEKVYSKDAWITRDTKKIQTWLGTQNK